MGKIATYEWIELFANQLADVAVKRGLDVSKEQDYEVCVFFFLSKSKFN